MQPAPEILAPLPLNKGQEAAAEGFFAFLFSEDKEMRIDGPGGVGKSFLMAHLIDKIMPMYFDSCKLMGIEPLYEEVHILALTNKAAEVLSEATQRPVQTLHSFLNLKVVDDLTKGTSRITKTPAWTVHQRKIIFIDECSMEDVPTDMLLQEGTQDCKIVFVGDDKQLRPVMGRCPIYDRPMPVFTLTEQMRTQIPEIQALHDQLRLTVETGVFKPIQIVPGIIDYLDNEKMQKSLQQTFREQTTKSRIMAYTNKRVMLYNEYIREIRQLPPEYTDGEMLINNSAIRLSGFGGKRAMLSTEAEVTISDIGKPYRISIETDVEMACFNATLTTRSGAVYQNVQIPVDRSHFKALVDHYARTKNWERMFHMKNTFPDLRQRDAATAYKAQGSTYDTGYIDLTDISVCRDPDQAARMLYVALSRERHRIFLFGELSEKYGGLIH